MGEFFELFGNFWKSIFNLLNQYSFDFNGISVSLSAIMFVFLVVGLVVTVFWRGAKT